MKYFLIVLMLFSTVISAEIDTTAISREICITNEGYEEGFYSQNNTVLCRTAVDGTQQATLGDTTYELTQKHNRRQYSFTVGAKLVDDDPFISHMKRNKMIIVSKGDHKMTFTPLSEDPGMVDATLLVENDGIMQFTYLNDAQEQIATVSLSVIETYESVAASVNIATKEHTTNHDTENLRNINSTEKFVVIVQIDGEQKQWAGSKISTTKSVGDYDMDLYRVLGKSDDGELILEEKVSVVGKINIDTIELYHFVDGEKVLLTSN